MIEVMEGMLIDWARAAKYTERRTLLVRHTLNLVKLEIEEWMFYERTGVDMPRGQRLWLANWKAIVEKAGMSVEEIDVGKLMSFVEGDFLKWQESGAAKQTSLIASIPPSEVVEVTKKLHEIFKAFNLTKMDLNAVAAYYLSRGYAGEETDFEVIKGQIKAAVRAPMSAEVWSLGQGPAPSLVRLKDSKGKPTGAEPLSQTRAPRGSKKASGSSPDLEEEEEGEEEGEEEEAPKKKLGMLRPTK